MVLVRGVAGSVPSRRAVAAPDVAARRAQAQVHPGAALAQALGAPLGGGQHRPRHRRVHAGRGRRGPERHHARGVHHRPAVGRRPAGRSGSRRPAQARQDGAGQVLVRGAVDQHDVGDARGVQLGDGLGAGREHHHVGLGGGGGQHSGDARRLLGLVVAEDDRAGVPRRRRLQDGGLGRVAAHHPQAGCLGLGGAVRGQRHHHDLVAAARQLPGEVAGGRAPPGQHHVTADGRVVVGRGLRGGRDRSPPLEAGGQRPAAGSQAGGGHEQQDGRGDERLGAVLPEPGRGQPDVAAEPLEHERELADLGEQQPGARGGGGADARRPGRRGGRDRLDDEDQGHGAHDQQRLLQQEADVEQRPDRQEEGRGEQDLQGQHLAECVRRVARLAHDQAGEEGPERDRHPGQGREVGGAQAQGDDREQEHLRRAGPRDGLQHRRHDPAGDHQRDGDDRQRGAEGADQPAGAATALAVLPDHGQHQHHRDDGEVLEDQQPEARLAGGGAGGAPVAEQLEHDGRRGQRDEQPGEHGRSQVDPGRHQQARRDQHGAQDLQRAAQQDQPSDRHEAADGELDADREQQQDDADLGGGVDDLPLAHDAERVRADQDAGQQEADDRDDPQPGAQVADHRPGDHERRDLRQELRWSLTCGQQHPGPPARSCGADKPRTGRVLPATAVPGPDSGRMSG
ncbi:MAG: hypothetical protein AVDCRST_MAG07-2462 [uncultured Frankineae bacterium]|uniref:Uncharacterized protein n=1 Tax=uncultured Frankineae bacterium TaxID=437475 RepID=A0A6J4LLE6_9ACTN|nr:MAG: hypothetical protein AVDCRST_MAG07-2462 [uncultured Frankineae bacterium]